MSHNPSPIGLELPPYAVALAHKARNGRLVIYAGAGLSAAAPTSLPSAAAMASSIFQRLSQLFPSALDCPSDDLNAVADAVAVLPGGEEALRETAVQVAEFTTASPNYGHKVLAYLLLEGVIDVLTTNWDNCIERGSAQERLTAVVTPSDRLQISGKSLLKIHGCASQPMSLLLTTAHLTSPPPWVFDETRARLGNSTVVFIGIGSVAAYVRKRIKEAVESISGIDNIRVVSPNIDEQWEQSGWAALVPELSPDHRYAVTADTFLEKLASAYLMVMLIETADALAEDPVAAERFQNAADSLKKHDPLTLLEWIRHSAVVPRAGSSAVTSPSTAKGLMAVGALAAENFKIGPRGVIRASNGTFEMMLAFDIQTRSRMRREAERRVDNHLSVGDPEPIFVIAGEVSSPPTAPGLLPDVIGPGNPSDIVGGPGNVAPTIKWAEEVLSA